MILIEIRKPYQEHLAIQFIEEMVINIFKYLGIGPLTDLSILIGSDLTLRNLNRDYRGIDRTTDVLSFESGEENPETGIISLGDIAISFPTAKKQAVVAGHPVENEVALLLVHAILHLQGYDHNSTKEKSIMWKKQQSLLDSLGVKINRISGDDEFHD